MVKRLRILGMAVFMITLLSYNLSAAQDPVKWSAPMTQYPNQWSPTTAPPQYAYPYVYNQSAYPPGYGAEGYWGYGTQYPGYYGRAQQGYSGNPYHHYYNR